MGYDGMKKLALIVSFLFIFMPTCNASDGYLGETNHVEFFVDAEHFEEHNGITEIVLITVDDTLTMVSNTKVDEKNKKFCMYHNLVIKKDSQYENYNNKWYDYTKDSYIQYALNYLHRRYAK